VDRIEGSTPTPEEVSTFAKQGRLGLPGTTRSYDPSPLARGPLSPSALAATMLLPLPGAGTP
jgi:hypothetical protein